MSDDAQTPNVLEQLAAMQQQIFQLLQNQQSQPQPQQQPQPTAADTSVHSIPTRPRYEWTPTHEQQELLGLGQDLFVGSPLGDIERRQLIESYPPVEGLNYQPPDAVPQAYRLMNDQQRTQDGSLKSTQYLISAVFRPLDILAHEMISNEGLEASGKYLKMIHDTRALLLHANFMINQYRTNLAYKTINRDFKVPSPDQRYTVPVDEFQSNVNQLHAANKSIREAKNFGKKKQKPFRSGTPSQHGGSHFDNTFFSSQQSSQNFNNNKPNNQRNNQHQGSSNNTNPFRKHNSTPQRK